MAVRPLLVYVPKLMGFLLPYFARPDVHGTAASSSESVCVSVKRSRRIPLAMRALTFIVAIINSIPALFRSRSQQAVVEFALRQQLATYTQTQSKPKLTPLDRAFWIALLRLWPRWKEVLVIVKPDTVVRWHRNGFRFYWRWISKPGPGRPRISTEVRALIERFALENGWGARKIHAELGKLGFTVSLATVSRHLPNPSPDRGKQQRWMTFLRNHKDGITAMDFLVVPTVRFRLLYVWCMSSDHSGQKNDFAKRRFSVSA
jgi:putative transposase